MPVVLGLRPVHYAAIPILLLGGVVLFEQGRWLWHRHHRRRAIERHWEYIDGELKEIEEVENAEETEEEDGLEAANPEDTRWAVAISRSPIGSWRQKLYTSLRFAGRFVNPFLEWRDKNATNIWEYIRWQLTRNNRNGIPKDEKELAESLPVVEPNFELLISFHISDSIEHLEASWVSVPPNPKARPSMTVTWLGQSTCFVQMDGYNILTDPIFSSRTVGNWLGPRRLRPPPCKLADLPRINIVLISHDHYDHLDRAVVKELGNSVTWYVPLGLKEWFNSHGVTKVVELDWWQECLHDDTLRIVGTPIQHWSGRHFFDVNRSLWSSFVVKGPTASFFHCGDTGYCTAFKEIGKKYGPITLAALPIGAYEPRWFLRHQHVDPDEACQIHEDLGASYSIGVHWGTFMMSDEHYLDPPKHLEESRQRRNIPPGRVFTSTLGETVCIF